MSHFDLSWVREQFPGLNTDVVLMDNAGGSQTLKAVMDRITHYLTHHDVQLGADYETSVTAAAQLQSSTEAVKLWLNAQHLEEVVIGPSTTALLRILSICLSQTWRSGDEVVITDVDHEANRACWMALEKQGMAIKTWRIDKNSLRLETEDLEALLTERTRLVCVTHVSNILGDIHPIAEWARLVHQHGAQICVDGVAYAPHRSLNVQAWDVDYYVFSTYKTFGPHQSVMYGKKALLENMPGINHEFITSSPYKFQPGNVNYELAYSLEGVVSYLAKLSGKPVSRPALKSAFDQVAAHEQSLIQPLIDFLNQYPETRIIGHPKADSESRVATVSFVHQKLDSRYIARTLNGQNIGIRYGDFYAVELIDALGLREQQGVVRVSLAHYNSADEVVRLVNALSECFEGKEPEF